ncbi:MAG: 4-hydroxy-tetrahydrodipicolinate reductase [Nitriliruptorales bacterium]|nr:4-hydroxy-tetrahydrodipicolinate reductase [Nitriliruptorales bacterium]
MSIRVGVSGAAGRMGSEVCRAVAGADDLELVCAVDPGADGQRLQDVAGVGGEIEIAGELDALTDAGVEVVVDFTHPDAVAGNVTWFLERGIHAVVGTTGITDGDLDRLRELAEGSDANAFFAPNFAIGAVLMMRFAEQAARHLPHVEVIELHHDGKAEAPSGTSLSTADRIAAARAEAPDPVLGEILDGARGADRGGIRVHSVRLPGLVAHQEVIFGGEGQTLTIRHDSVDRVSFMPGVLLAVRRVAELDGLVVGLDTLLE